MKVALFVPCFVNALYPEVGEASYRLLRSLGLDVDYPLEQTCCGQPMGNAGYEKDAEPLARRMEELFAKYPTPEALAEAPLSDIEAVVRPCGLYRTKAKNLTFSSN